MDHSLPSLFFVQGVAFVSELPVGLARLRRVKPPDARLVVIFCGLGEFPIASDRWAYAIDAPTSCGGGSEIDVDTIPEFQLTPYGLLSSAKPGIEQVPRGFARSDQGLIMRNPISTARDLSDDRRQTDG